MSEFHSALLESNEQVNYAIALLIEAGERTMYIVNLNTGGLLITTTVSVLKKVTGIEMITVALPLKEEKHCVKQIYDGILESCYRAYR